MRALRNASITVLDVATSPDEHDLALLRRRLDRLGETALMIDDWLDRNNAAQSLSVTSEDLALRVFDAQIALEQLASLLVEPRAGRSDAERTRGRHHVSANMPAAQPV